MDAHDHVRRLVGHGVVRTAWVWLALGLGACAMGVTASVRLDVALTDALDTVLADDPTFYWRLNDTTGTTAQDENIGRGGVGANPGTYAGAPALGLTSPIPTGGTCVGFDGTDDYIWFGLAGGPTFDPSQYWSFEAWVWLHASGMGTVRTVWWSNGTGTNQIRLRVSAADQFIIENGTDTLTDATARASGTWYHVVVTGQSASGAWRIYVNGALAAGPTTPTVTSTAGNDMIIGRNAVGANHFYGRLDDVAFFTGAASAYALSAARVLAHYNAGQWTNITADTVAQSGLRVTYGIAGSGPLNRVASSGECTFALRNDAGNSGAQQGYYSPAHASKRAGWGKGIPLRIVFTYSGTEYTKFRGRNRSIVPDAGQYLSRRVTVTAYDCLRDLMDADVREVTLQSNKTETQLIETVLAAVPIDARPVALDLDAGVDTYPYAFDNLGAGARAARVLRDLVVSAFGFLIAKGDGTLTYSSRQTLAVGASSFTFANTMHGLQVPSSLDRSFNRVRVTIHPKQVSAAATDELYTLPAIGTLDLAAGATLTLWTDYTDPDDRQVPIGGLSVVTTLVGGTHYGANSAADGSGSDLTSSITASVTPFATTAKWTLTNAAAVRAYLTILKVIGKAVRNPGSQTFEASSSQAYGDQPLSIDMPYQDDAAVGQGAAEYVEAQYRSNDAQPEEIEFLANASADFMTQALTREPGDRITVTEPVTGVTLVEGIITRVHLDVTPGPMIVCRWGLAPVQPFSSWLLGTAGQSELGATTVLGF